MVNVRLTDAEYAALKKEADSKGISVSEALRDLIKELQRKQARDKYG
jgi:hypothetical protein